VTIHDRPIWKRNAQRRIGCCPKLVFDLDRMSDPEIRTRLSIGQRAEDLRLEIDPSFVHHRKIDAIFGPEGREILRPHLEGTLNLPGFLASLRVDHLYTDFLVEICETIAIPTLELALASGVRSGLFCSVEVLPASKKVPRSNHAIVKWRKAGRRIQLEYDNRRVVGDTLSLHLRRGGSPIALIAEFRVVDGEYQCRPLVMGFPVLRLPENKDAEGWPMFFRHEFYEHFVEDFDEFSKVSNEPIPKDCDPMRLVSERAFKLSVASILGGTVPDDWGGESSDFYTSQLHINGKRMPGAFLFKGPANFRPMGLNHLGKNNDQLVRLSNEPAKVLIVQHSHEILPPVRATLRALAVQPGNPRRYALFDGRDSLRLLRAYDLYDRAVALTIGEKRSKSKRRKS
jgi:hypothetical protein